MGGSNCYKFETLESILGGKNEEQYRYLLYHHSSEIDTVTIWMPYVYQSIKVLAILKC